MIIKNNRLNQHTLFNCFDTYGDELNSNSSEIELDQSTQNYLCAIREF